MALIDLLKRLDLWLGALLFGGQGLDGDVGFTGELVVMHIAKSGKVKVTHA